MDSEGKVNSNANTDEHSTNNVVISSLIQKTLRVQCVFLIEKELEVLKNKHIMSDVQHYLEEADVINFHKILLTIVKSFTQQYFEEIKSDLMKIWQKIPTIMGGQHIETGATILDKCLTILEKRLFETLYEELDQQPIQYLSVLNMFDLNFVKKQEKYVIDYDKPNSSQEDCRNEEYVAAVKSINIFELIKYVYYNAVIETKKELSTRIFKKFIKDNVIKDFKKGKKYQRNPCLYYNSDKTKIKEDSIEEKKLRIVEYLIKEMWNHMPDLKNPMEFKCEALPLQLNSLISYREQNENPREPQNAERHLHVNWNYNVTRDGETMYLNAPSYGFIHEITPQLTRKLLDQTQITEEDIIESERHKSKSRKPDVFDVRMEAILDESKRLVGDELFDYEQSSKVDVQTYFQMVQDHKKEIKIQQEKWKVFEKKYFNVQGLGEEYDHMDCQVPIRPLEFHDLVPKTVLIKVAPISYEFEQIKYLCAACGYFIDKGTGVEAMNYKWHTNHFRCRACCGTFKEPSDAILYKGNIVLCMYDARMIIQ